MLFRKKGELVYNILRLIGTVCNNNNNNLDRLSRCIAFIEPPFAATQEFARAWQIQDLDRVLTACMTVPSPRSYKSANNACEA